ncbi:28S ribosomal protein S5, mitochondrial [Diatrype stigma]|uniref:Small ribosomal subunit protein uS5m n=1 Tax=Diatrype stigma TaxID=117547 RepID=A0AAN9YJ86_9PEZI
MQFSARLAARRRPRFKSIRADEMGLTTPEKVEEHAQTTFPGYSPEEMEILRQKYTPEQMAALEAGEAAIDPRDLTIQARLRRDPYRLPYLDDFSRVMPIVDKRQRNPDAPAFPDPNARFMDKRENLEDFMQWGRDIVPPELQHLLESSSVFAPPQLSADDEARIRDLPEAEREREMARLQRDLAAAEVERMKPLRAHLEKVMPLEAAKFWNERSTMTDKGTPGQTAMVPALGKKLRGVEGLFTPPIDPEDKGLDDSGRYKDLKRRMGMNVPELLDIKVKTLVSRRVDNQSRLGKIQSFWVLAIAGNRDGRLGIGEAKSVEPVVAQAKAKMLAIQNLQPIRRYEDRTIFGKVKAKVGATIVEIAARPPGFGLRASHRLFEIFRAVGIHDIAAKMPRGRNPMNSVKACVQALQSQKDPNELAIGRGKKLVDVRKVYYGGNVY